MSESDFEGTVYNMDMRIVKPGEEIRNDPNLPGAVSLLGRTKQQYVFQKAPNGYCQMSTGITDATHTFRWRIEEGWLIITELLEGKPITQSFHIGMGIDELITSDGSFRYYLTKEK